VTLTPRWTATPPGRSYALHMVRVIADVRPRVVARPLYLLLMLVFACGLMRPSIAQPTQYVDVATYMAALRIKIRGNWILPAETPDNATVTFHVVLSQSGEVTSLRRVNPSGFELYDQAIEQAIFKSQPLPVLLLPGGEMERELRLTFKPRQ
jgi:hypothetical protein